MPTRLFEPESVRSYERLILAICDTAAAAAPAPIVNYTCYQLSVDGTNSRIVWEEYTSWPSEWSSNQRSTYHICDVLVLSLQNFPILQVGVMRVALSLVFV